MTKLLEVSIEEKIDFIRTDFYKQVEDINYLPKMTMTFDDGPFYGVPFEEPSVLRTIEMKETNFGFLTVSKVDDKMILTSENKNKKIIWQKIITGRSNRKLTELKFSNKPIEYNSVATVIHMSSEGERFTLYLKKDGSFMYYFHSW